MSSFGKEKEPMNLDIRLPMGLMFLVVGIMLSAYGAATNGDSALYAKSLGANINLIWGAALTVFGALMVWFARRAMHNKTEKN
jgi:ABC-type Fe3+-siderophore transport system permease subunit